VWSPEPGRGRAVVKEGSFPPMHGTRDEILENLATIRARIARGADHSGRDPSEVLVVAAAKTVPLEAVRWVVEQDVAAIGHNYVKELREMHGLVPGVRWHFIGTLQTNTAHHVAALADVVETVAGEHATERLSRRSAAAHRLVDVLIEVDFTGERQGVPPEAVASFADRVASMDGLRLRGLMTLPPLPADVEEARGWFQQLRALRDHVRDAHPEVVELSMGMSLDYEVAVEEGATMVRIGTALFGPRTA
jgi:pyridoxal phosphate enzyme (YggS family)